MTPWLQRREKKDFWTVLVAPRITHMRDVFYVAESSKLHHALGDFSPIQQWTFKLHRGIKLGLTNWKCCSGHLCWLRIFVRAVMTGSFNKTMLQFTTHFWFQTMNALRGSISITWGKLTIKKKSWIKTPKNSWTVHCWFIFWNNVSSVLCFYRAIVLQFWSTNELVFGLKSILNSSPLCYGQKIWLKAFDSIVLKRPFLNNDSFVILT